MPLPREATGDSHSSSSSQLPAATTRTALSSSRTRSAAEAEEAAPRRSATTTKAESSYDSSPPRSRPRHPGDPNHAAPDPTTPRTPSSSLHQFLSPMSSRREPPHESKISSPLISVSIRDDDPEDVKSGTLQVPPARHVPSTTAVAGSKAEKKATNLSFSGNDARRKRTASEMASSSSSVGADPAATHASLADVKAEHRSGPHIPSHTSPPPQAAADGLTTGSAAASSSSAAKRPYIRTKRPKNYSDRSTITSTTDALYEAHVHPYDAVLSEATDLLGAAAEAQHLGRAKAASAYLLLLHARLVGLGRRFDKTGDADIDDDDEDEEEGGEDGKGAVDGDHSKKKKESPHTNNTKSPHNNHQEGAAASGAGAAPPPSAAGDPLLTPKSRAVKEFTKLLPKDIQMDQAMMEHLAKAAVELHAARSRKHHHHPRESNPHQPHFNPPPFVSAQPPPRRTASSGAVPDARSFLATTANRQGIVTAATAATGTGTVPPIRAAALKAATTKTNAKPNMKAVGTGIAWTDDEIRILNRSRADSMSSDQLASLLPGRTEQQVKTYLKNQNERQRVQLETMESLSVQADHPQPNGETHVGSSDLESADVPTSASHMDLTLDAAAHGPIDASPPHRARKPATTAIYTAPNAICDARALLSHVRKQALSRQEKASTDRSTPRSMPSKAFDK